MGSRHPMGKYWPVVQASCGCILSSNCMQELNAQLAVETRRRCIVVEWQVEEASPVAANGESRL
jgi:hypothetical protein